MYFAQTWYVLVLALLTLCAAVALLAIHVLKRGNETGRWALIVLSAVAIAWALTPCFDMATESPPRLMPLLIAVSVVKRLGYIGLGLATLLSLLQPSARAFTQPTLPHLPA